MARTGRKNDRLFRTNPVRRQNRAREDFRQRADTAGADFLSPQLLNTGNVRLGYEIKRRPVGYGQDDFDLSPCLWRS